MNPVLMALFIKSDNCLFSKKTAHVTKSLILLGGVGDREWEFKISDTLNPLIDSETWELRREGEEELGGPSPLKLFPGGPW